jgi:hypothetical protein
LGKPKPKRARIPTLGVYQANGQKALPNKQMIRDGLLEHDRFKLNRSCSRFWL